MTNPAPSNENNKQGLSPSTSNGKDVQSASSSNKNIEQVTEPPQENIIEKTNKLEIFEKLIINIRWNESRRKGYTPESLVNWKKTNNEWKLLDQNLEFLNVGKVIKKFLDDNEDRSIDLTKCDMKNIPNFWDDLYGTDEEVKHKSCVDTSENSSDSKIKLNQNITEDQDDEFHDSHDNNVDIDSILQSTTLETKKKSNHSDEGLTKLAQILQLSNGVMPAINHLKTADDDVKEWFSHFDLISKSHGWSNETKGVKLPLYLKKDAQHIWQNLSESNRYDYLFVKDTLSKEMINEVSKSQARTAFFQAFQTSSERPEDYGRRIKKLARKTGISLNEEDLIDRFISGLRAEIRLTVLGSVPKTVDDAIKFASKVDRYASKSHQQSEINSIKTESKTENDSDSEDEVVANIDKTAANKNEKIICHYCTESGHVKSQCKLRKRALLLVKCNQCNKHGHYSKYCPAKEKAPASKDQGWCRQ